MPLTVAESVVGGFPWAWALELGLRAGWGLGVHWLAGLVWNAGWESYHL